MILGQTSSLWSRAAVPTTPLKRRVGRGPGLGPGDPTAAEGSMAPGIALVGAARRLARAGLSR